MTGTIWCSQGGSGHVPPLDPQDARMAARTHIRIGVCYLWMGFFDKAEAAMMGALAVRPRNAQFVDSPTRRYATRHPDQTLGCSHSN